MAWTHFMDMCSGGEVKVGFDHIFIEASEDEACRLFEKRFGRDPSNVTCDCCGPDYSVSDNETLEKAAAYYRGTREPREPALFIYADGTEKREGREAP